MKNETTYRAMISSGTNIDPVSGSQFWSVEGQNVQFTWFEVPPKTSFPKHKHESEQITYVIEGELFFRSADAVYKLSKGDCILIPGNAEHEAWTETSPATAVDAWAPINKEYSNYQKS
jgi:quercetin dioxygenase-like cupin family protein